jgi:plastocyanin
MIASCGDDEQDAVEVTATDFRFEGLPERIEAGTEVTMRNASSTELHELIAFRLPDGEQRSADELMSLPEEELGALFAGPPPFGLVAAPGESSTPALGDGTFTEPGRYLVFCAIPTGADPAEAMAAMREAGDAPEGGPPAITGGPPHFVHGMYAELFVE